MGAKGSPSRRRASYLLALAMGSLSLAGGASAANLSVFVAQPPVGGNVAFLAGAQICLASADGSRRVSKTATSAGSAVFLNVGPGTYQVTASKNGFVGVAVQVAMSSTNRTETLTLQPGSGGVTCYPQMDQQDSGQGVPPPAPPPAVPRKGMRISHSEVEVFRREPAGYVLRVNFSIDPGDLDITQPTHYRIGYQTDLSDATWQPLERFFFFHLLPYRPGDLTAFGHKVAYIQAKHVAAKKQSPLDLTPAKGVEVHQTPASFANFTANAPAGVREHKLEGETLKSMLSYAANRGFPLNLRLITATQSICSGFEFNRSRLEFNNPAGLREVGWWEKEVEASLLEIGAKKLTPGWRVKNISIGNTPDLGSTYQISRPGEPDGDGFRRRIKMLTTKSSNAGVGGCLSARFPLDSITLEGPQDDIVLDVNEPWKNAFPAN